ncbi:hypothetical protein N497_16520 [Clostridium botulinum F 357]|nr:hypothetical protein N497_16520 [Clostridium botulinum F 357]
MKRGIQMIETNYYELPVLLEPKEIQDILKINMHLVYKIIKRSDFPKLRINERQVKIPKILLMKWIKENKEFLIEYRKIG